MYSHTMQYYAAVKKDFVYEKNVKIDFNADV